MIRFVQVILPQLIKYATNSEARAPVTLQMEQTQALFKDKQPLTPLNQL